MKSLNENSSRSFIESRSTLTTSVSCNLKFSQSHLYYGKSLSLKNRERTLLLLLTKTKQKRNRNNISDNTDPCNTGRDAIRQLLRRETSKAYIPCLIMTIVK